MGRKRIQPPRHNTAGNLTDYYDRVEAYYKSKKDGRLYIGVENRKEGIVTMVARIDFTPARNRTITILKPQKTFAL